MKEVKKLVDFVCANNLGQGAVREFVEAIKINESEPESD